MLSEHGPFRTCNKAISGGRRQSCSFRKTWFAYTYQLTCSERITAHALQCLHCKRIYALRESGKGGSSAVQKLHYCRLIAQNWRISLKRILKINANHISALWALFLDFIGSNPWKSAKLRRKSSRSMRPQESYCQPASVKELLL